MASKPERELALHIRLSGLSEPETEYRFHDKRKWRLDFAWPALKIGVEVQGGGHGRGRHHRNEGYRKDCEKLAFAVMAGWKLIYVVPEQIKSGEALHWITELIRAAEDEQAAKQIAREPSHVRAIICQAGYDLSRLEKQVSMAVTEFGLEEVWIERVQKAQEERQEVAS